VECELVISGELRNSVDDAGHACKTDTVEIDGSRFLGLHLAGKNTLGFFPHFLLEVFLLPGK
jgi:hypothetical protein